MVNRLMKILYNNKTRIHKSTPFNIFFILGISALLIGILYYLYFRPLPIGLLWLSDSLIQNWLPSPLPNLHHYQEWFFSIPSFLYVVAFSLLTLSAITASSRNIFVTGTAWFLINGIFEIIQSLDPKLVAVKLAEPSDSSIAPWLNIRGTFDWLDLIAAAMGMAFFTIIARGCNRKPKDMQQQGKVYSSNTRPNVFFLVPVFLVGIFSITGSYEACPQGDASATNCGSEQVVRSIVADPIYMSYQEFRTNAIFIDPDRSLTGIGKIYLYNNLVFINTPNEGVHVYDNTDPYSPTKMTFINIPGNIDIAIHQGYLYVDSYMDLVTVDIHDILSPTVVNRQIDIFPYDVYQNIPDNIVFSDIDKTKGVIVGYTVK